MVGVEYVDKPYEVRTGASLALPLVGPLDLYPSVYRYVQPIAEYDEVWQLEANVRLRLARRTAPVLPYLGGGVAVQPALLPLAGPNPDASAQVNVYSVLLAGVEFMPRSTTRPVFEVQMVGTGPDGSPSYGGGEVAILAGVSFSLGHDPLRDHGGPAPECTSGAPTLAYDDCALRLKHRFFSTQFVQGQDETVAARFTFLAPRLDELMQRSDSAWGYYWAFRERYNRGFWLMTVGGALFLGGTIIATDPRHDTLGAALMFGGIGFNLAGIIDAAKSREPLAKAIWWYNRSLTEPDP